MPGKQINLAYLHEGSLGYGRAGIELAKALPRQGVTVFDQLLGAPGQFDMWNQGKTPGITPTACWFSYPTHAPGWFEGQYAACFTMWETAYLPEAFRGVLDNFDLIIVPSEQNVEMFSRWHPNVKYVPLGIDTQAWTPTARQEPDRYFRFLTSGSGPRKGVDLVQAAFERVFPDGSWPKDGPIPTLQIKSQKAGPRQGPRVETIIGRLSAQEELNLYAQAHVYVQASRGEGFGLQPLQAIAQALPTILTDAHGHKAFSHLGMGLSARLEHNTKAGGYFSFGESGDWWEPNFDELCDWMLYSYDNYDEVKRDAWDSALLAQRFTWDETAARFLDAFPQGQLESTGDPGRYVTVEQRLFRVRVQENFKMDIAGTVHAFEPGRDYWEPADIKRFLFDANRLDPQCLLELDSGLTAEQVARLDSYSSDHAFCPHCRQQYNSGLMWTPAEERAG